ncbi:glycogen synthase GlgA [Vibrio sp.]|nr:glycogen synthase GlgA [Vibrio sp.]
MATKHHSILFVASEMEGLIKSGGLADVAKALPESLIKLGHDVRVSIPAYAGIDNIGEAKVIISTQLDTWPHTPYQVVQLSVNAVPVYGIRCSQYFERAEMYAENNQAYADNGERYAFFSAACLDMLPKLGFQPDIVHANDWHTGFVPYLLKKRYSTSDFFAQTKSIISIHNAVFKGVFSYDELQTLPEMQSRHVPEAELSHTHVAMLKAGILCADKVNAVSPTYAEELKTYLGSHGMAEEFRSRDADLVGILNGCDYSAWDPSNDPHIAANFTATVDSMKQGKALNKHALQAEVGLPEKSVSMFGMVCRLTSQKGLQYLLPILERFLKNDVQVTIVGTGDPVIAAELHSVAGHFPDKFAFVEAYSNKLAHLVEAGSDFFIMPSEFEPCGLNQLYSMAYGTLPIVRSVGGLKDTVTDIDEDAETATGLSFIDPEPVELLVTLQRALLLYHQQPEFFTQVQMNGMQRIFSWDEAAVEYEELYSNA